MSDLTVKTNTVKLEIVFQPDAFTNDEAHEVGMNVANHLMGEWNEDNTIFKIFVSKGAQK